jgi:hypothetical protein
MANNTAWIGGRLGPGLGFATLINSSDLVSLPNGSGVLSSVGDITNGTSLDQYMDISIRLAIASTTLTAGAGVALYLYPLLDDGTTYGDGLYATPGTQTVGTPALPPVPVNFRVATLTSLVYFVQGLVLPPGSFRFALVNNLLPSTALSAGTQTVKYRTYNQNLNA